MSNSEKQIAEIRNGLTEADAGDFATNEENATLDAKWGYRAGKTKKARVAPGQKLKK